MQYDLSPCMLARILLDVFLEQNPRPRLCECQQESTWTVSATVKAVGRKRDVIAREEKGGIAIMGRKRGYCYHGEEKGRIDIMRRKRGVLLSRGGKGVYWYHGEEKGGIAITGRKRGVLISWGGKGVYWYHGEEKGGIAITGRKRGVLISWGGKGVYWYHGEEKGGIAITGRKRGYWYHGEEKGGIDIMGRKRGVLISWGGKGGYWYHGEEKGGIDMGRKRGVLLSWGGKGVYWYHGEKGGYCYHGEEKMGIAVMFLSASFSSPASFTLIWLVVDSALKKLIFLPSSSVHTEATLCSWRDAKIQLQSLPTVFQCHANLYHYCITVSLLVRAKSTICLWVATAPLPPPQFSSLLSVAFGFSYFSWI